MEPSQRNPLYASMTRRRALTAAGAGFAGVAGAALVGCSSSSKKPAADAGRPAVAVAPAAPADDKPKPGGVLRYPQPKDPDSLDPYRLAFATGGTWAAVNAYSKLFTLEPGVNRPASGKIIGDLAQSWEQVDPLTLNIKLNPAAKFDQKEPLNGRQVTAEDVVTSYNRFAKESYDRANLVNAVNKLAPIDKITAIDKSTVQVKMAVSDSTVLALLCGSLWVMPVEGLSGKIDFQKEQRGSGPYLFDSYKPSVELNYKRNPNWHLSDGGRPWADLQIKVIPDQAQTETQFRAKNLQWASVALPNIPQFSKDLKDTEIAIGNPDVRSPLLGMSWLPNQPWNDIRVRHALSMAINRDQLAEVVYNKKQFDAMGVKLTVRWNAPIAGGYGAYWLDPKDTAKFGPSSAYVQHNIAEAKKLLDAAGYNAQKPLEFGNVYAGVYYGQDWPTRVEVLQSMMRDAGMKMNSISVDYATDYIPKYFTAKAKYDLRDGKPAVQFPPGGANIDPVNYYSGFLSSTGGQSQVGDKFPELDAKIVKAKGITNFEERVAAVHDMQRYSTEQMIVIPVGPGMEGIDLVWKGLRGPQVFKPWTTTVPFGTAANMYLLPEYWFADGKGL
ncbi:MAG: ABC transporter substrate-binding protein [Dehalococcoidia bacterium]|nr:ABC transporter substrate-binding protein [Dehalococcoidia bacterium]